MRTVVAVSGLVIGLLAGCTSRYSSAAPPAAACGTPLSDSVAGPVVYDLARNPTEPVVTEETVGGVLIVRVSDACGHGSEVTLTPSSAGRIARTATAADGLPEAVVVRPTGSMCGRLVATQRGSVVGVLRFCIR